MGLDLWAKQDIARMIASMVQGANRNPRTEYWQGYMDALSDFAVAFGLYIPEDTNSVTECIHELSD